MISEWLSDANGDARVSARGFRDKGRDRLGGVASRPEEVGEHHDLVGARSLTGRNPLGDVGLCDLHVCDLDDTGRRSVAQTNGDLLQQLVRDSAAAAVVDEKDGAGQPALEARSSA